MWLLDEMGQRVDDLEKNISDLMQQVDSKEDTSLGGGGSGPTQKWHNLFMLKNTILWFPKFKKVAKNEFHF